MKKTRNGTIDFFRFIFAICIVIHHGYLLFEGSNYTYTLFERGAIGVEFFFLVSGFLMAKSINKEKDDNAIEDSTIKFMFKKISSFYPAFFISYVISIILISIFCYTGEKMFITRFFDSIWELLLIRGFGFQGVRSYPASWYLSAMVIAMTLIYPIYKKNKGFFEKYLSLLIPLLIFGYMFHTTKSILNIEIFMGIMYKSTLRAIGVICLGIFSYSVCEKLKRITFTNQGEKLLTFIEWFGYLLTIFYMQFFKEFKVGFDFLILLFLAISVTLSFSNKTKTRNIFNKEIYIKLGKYSLYPYLIYYPFGVILGKYMKNLTPIIPIFLYLVLTFLVAFAIMKIEKPVMDWLKSIKKYFIKEVEYEK